MKTYIQFAYLTSLFIGASYLSSCSSKPTQTEGEALPKISVAVPEVRDVTYQLDYPGYLTSLETVDLVARVDGTLDEIHFKSGQRVAKGQLLMVIEPKSYQDKVEQAKANLNTSKARLALASASLERVKEAARSNAVSELDVIKAQSEFDQASAALVNSQSQLEVAETNLSYCYVKAPFSGLISKNNVDKGNYVSGMSRTVLATVYNDDQVYVYFNMEDSKYYSVIANHPKAKDKGDAMLGTEVFIRISDRDELTYTGKLDYLAPNIDLTTGTISMRAVFNNAKRELRSGVFVKVLIPAQTKKNAVMVPEASIGSDQSGRYLYVVNDSNVVRYQSIQIGVLESDNMREVISGITPNERYVDKALLRVRDGMRIDPQMQKK